MKKRHAPHTSHIYRRLFSINITVTLVLLMYIGNRSSIFSTYIFSNNRVNTEKCNKYNLFFIFVKCLWTNSTFSIVNN